MRVYTIDATDLTDKSVRSHPTNKPPSVEQLCGAIDDCLTDKLDQ